MSYQVYIVRTARGSLYTGITTDPDRRVREHNGKGKRGAKCLRGQRPVELVWLSEMMTRSQALRLEYKIKTMTHSTKLDLIEANDDLSGSEV